ncbi:MAG: class I SAM-dependent methyltransferase [Actinomycetota bacterium]|nr:class I SAM-dependent methyltransferase [Actinomycetota bacterium]
MRPITRWKRRAYRIMHPRAPRAPRVRLLERVPKGSVCAEIGVWKGDFSERILEIVRPARLHLIDPWQAVSGEDYEGARYGRELADGQAEMDAIYASVLERFERERRAGVVAVHRLPSAEAVRRFRDEELDFVYIDGNHRYEFVKADLEAYASKVRPGGFLAGDDYGVAGWWEDGVTRAVDEFIAAGAASVVALEDRQFVLRLPTSARPPDR